MATPKKKHLIELMIEEGVEWPEGAEYAAQDKTTNDLCFYRSKPVHNARFKDEWRPSGLDRLDGLVGRRINLPSICRNWYQTIVTREQYADALALAANVSEPAVDAVEWHNPPSIEQLTSDYHAKAAEADRLQSVADEALKAADDALLALEKAGELIGMVISIDTKTKQAEQPVEPAKQIITDWRDLRVGDVIECVPYGDERDGEKGEPDNWPGGWARSIVGTNHVVESVDHDSGEITLLDVKDSGYAFRFIRRP